MNGVDTNILIYRLDRQEPVKRPKARALIRRLVRDPVSPVLLWQVAGEFLRHLRSWQDQGLLTRPVLLGHVHYVQSRFQLVLPTAPVLDRALDLSHRYSLSHWDSMLLGACLEAGVDTLYTEDMGAPTT